MIKGLEDALMGGVVGHNQVIQVYHANQGSDRRKD